MRSVTVSEPHDVLLLFSILSHTSYTTFFQSASDVLRIYAYMHTMSPESSSLCEKFGVCIGNFSGNNAKGKIKNAVLNKLKALCSVG